MTKKKVPAPKQKAAAKKKVTTKPKSPKKIKDPIVYTSIEMADKHISEKFNFETTIENVSGYNNYIQSQYAIESINTKITKKLSDYKSGFFVYNKELYYKCSEDYIFSSDGENNEFYKNQSSIKVFTVIKLRFVPVEFFRTLLEETRGLNQFYLEELQTIKNSLSVLEESWKENL